jgi:hypothetical protein
MSTHPAAELYCEPVQCTSLLETSHIESPRLKTGCSYTNHHTVAQVQFLFHLSTLGVWTYMTINIGYLLLLLSHLEHRAYMKRFVSLHFLKPRQSA